MKKATTTLAVTSPAQVVSTAVVPKPTRNEVIESLARVRFAQMEEDYKKSTLSREKSGKEIEAKIRKWAIKNIRSLTADTKVKLGNLYSDKLSWVEVEINATNRLPVDLERELIAWHKGKNLRRPDFKEVKAEIREGITNSPVGMEARVQALISNPKTKNALERMLDELGVTENSKAIAA
jgi:hypothetical protein